MINKKILSILFIILGVIINIFIILFLSLVVLVVIGYLSKFLPRDFILFLTISGLISAILTSFIIYHKLLNFLRIKYKLDEYIDPLFNKKDNS